MNLVLNIAKSILLVAAILIGLAGAKFIMNNEAKEPSKLLVTPVKNSKLGAIVRLVRDGRTVCSGTVVSPHIIITAAHCILEETSFGLVMNVDPLEIRADDNIPRKVFGIPFYATAQLDQALLTGDFYLFDTKKCITDPVELATIVATQKTFVSCGYPMGGNLYCADTNFVRSNNFFWAVNGQLIPGMSGGPTMSLDGTIIAVNCAVTDAVSLVSPLWNINNHFNDKDSK